MQYLGENFVLLQNVEEYSITDHLGNTKQLNNSCEACIIKTPCGIKIQVKAMIIFVPACMGQTAENDTISVGHLTNLHLVAPMINTEMIARLSTQFQFPKPVNISFPQIDIFQHEGDQAWNDAFKILDSPNIDLGAVINDMLKQGVVFRSQMDR
jgi:hypothetical protein